MMPLPDDELTIEKAAEQPQFSYAAYMDRLGALPPRTRELCERLMLGVEVKVAAAEMGIAVHTARNHLKVAYKKLGVAGSRAAVMAYLLLGVRSQ